LKKLGNLFFDPKNGFFAIKKVEITLISWAISTSVAQRYEISKRNANPLTLVNTNIILHFSAFFRVRIGAGITWQVQSVPVRRNAHQVSPDSETPASQR
jgi:hypothetical protein